MKGKKEEKKSEKGHTSMSICHYKTHHVIVFWVTRFYE